MRYHFQNAPWEFQVEATEAFTDVTKLVLVFCLEMLRIKIFVKLKYKITTYILIV